jgi:hypothetical protein
MWQRPDAPDDGRFRSLEREAFGEESDADVRNFGPKSNLRH